MVRIYPQIFLRAKNEGIFDSSSRSDKDLRGARCEIGCGETPEMDEAGGPRKGFDKDLRIKCGSDPRTRAD